MIFEAFNVILPPLFGWWSFFFNAYQRTCNLICGVTLYEFKNQMTVENKTGITSVHFLWEDLLFRLVDHCGIWVAGTYLRKWSEEGFGGGDRGLFKGTISVFTWMSEKKRINQNINYKWYSNRVPTKYKSSVIFPYSVICSKTKVSFHDQSNGPNVVVDSNQHCKKQAQLYKKKTGNNMYLQCVIRSAGSKLLAAAPSEETHRLTSL